MGVKMNLRMITKNPAVDPEIGFLKISILKQYGRAKAMPTAWELRSTGRFPTTYKNGDKFSEKSYYMSLHNMSF